MKNQLLSVLFVAFTAMIMAQTNATNFTANDCSGVSHELFKDLDSGKVIVMVWVMPCGACTGPAITAYNIVKDFQVSNPNKVYYYMVDDYANTNCQSLGSWCTSNGIEQNSYSLRFSNSKIKMSDYGSDGMPKIVVVAGNDHKVYYNVNNTVNPTNLQKAINTALILTGTSDQNNTESTLTISPNPVKESTVVSFNLEKAANVKMDLLNVEGKLIQTVFSGKLASGENSLNVNMANYNQGIYFVKLSYENKSKLAKFSVAH
ncbi:MAG: T9SS type A sorting domain-containing protein [Saprospiraceae bacterium]|nr:T9SS type A sorting domain-containing protein [Saprospiraceae bacterium]MBK8298746.1 T9SS type A sorting domain-containing protein [Saprospiraceae bacterium]